MDALKFLRLAGIGVAWSGFLFFAGPWLAARLNAGWGLARWELPFGRCFGWLIIAAGCAVLAWAARAFRVHGGGTPVPTDPPVRIVEGGLYAWSRNPIYVADIAILSGIFALRGEVLQLAWAALAALGLHAWIVLHEEPLLLRRFGADWTDYARRVPRWFGRRR